MSTPAIAASTETPASTASRYATGEVMDFSVPPATTGHARSSAATAERHAATATPRPNGSTAASVPKLARTVRRNWKMGTAIATTAGPSSQLIHSVAALNSS